MRILAFAVLLLAGTAAAQEPRHDGVTDWWKVATEPKATPQEPRRIFKENMVIGHAVALDGDTLTVGGIKVRLWGVDAPEMKNWPWGPRARGALDTILNSHEMLICEARGKSHDRTVARCWLKSPQVSLISDGSWAIPVDQIISHDIGARLIASGYAVEYRTFARIYSEHETSARTKRLGIWRE